MIKVNFNFIDGKNLLIQINFKSYDEFIQGFIKNKTYWFTVNSSNAATFTLNMSHVLYMEEVFL